MPGEIAESEPRFHSFTQHINYWIYSENVIKERKDLRASFLMELRATCKTSGKSEPKKLTKKHCIKNPIFTTKRINNQLQTKSHVNVFVQHRGCGS